MKNGTRPRPHFPRSFSEGNDADGGYHLLHDMRRSQSLPGSLPSSLRWGQRKNARVQTRIIRPFFKHAALPRLPKPAAPSTPPTPRLNGGIPMTRTGRGRQAPPAQQGHEAPAAAPENASTPTVGLGINLTGSSTGESAFPWIPVAPTNELANNNRVEHDNTNNGDDDEELATYPFRPPGLSTPVPWPQDEPTTGGEHGRRRSMTPPGAPLLRSIAHFGRQHHSPCLDHAPAGLGDEDLSSRGAVLTPRRPNLTRSYAVAPQYIRTQPSLPNRPRIAYRFRA